jgi:hypothetical protein
MYNYVSPWPETMARYSAWYSVYKTTTGAKEEIIVRYRKSDGLIYSGSLRKDDGTVYHARRNQETGVWSFVMLPDPWTSEKFPVEKETAFLDRLRKFMGKGQSVSSRFLFPDNYSEVLNKAKCT